MADLSDVTTALKTLVAGILYPAGPPAANDVSAAGVIVRVVEGWPEKQQLDAMLKAGKAMVSVFPTDYERVIQQMTTNDWVETERKEATYTLEVDGQELTVGGAAPAEYFTQNIAALVNGQAYIVTAGEDDPAEFVADELHALLVADFPGAARVGAVITLPDEAIVEAVRVGTCGIAIKGVRRQEQGYMITVWAGSPAHRKAIGKLVDSELTVIPWIDLEDGQSGRLLFRSQSMNDTEQLQGVWRRDFVYTVEYSTTQVEEQVEIVTFVLNMRGGDDVLIKTERA